MTSPKQRPHTIELQVRINAPKEAVWKALTEASELARWFPPMAAGKAGLGEELLLSWGPDLQWRTEVVAFEPGRHLLWRDKSAPGIPSGEEGDAPPSGAGTPQMPSAPTPMAVDWTLESADGQVVVRLVQSGFGEGDAWDDFYDGTDRGWRFYLNALRHYLERHRGTPRDMVSVRRPARGGPAVPWRRVWSQDGFAPTPAAAQLTVGQAFEVQLGAERLAGTVDFVQAPHAFWGTLGSLEDATLLVEMEPGRDQLHCGIWLSTYGLPEARVQALQRGLTAMADRALAGMD